MIDWYTDLIKDDFLPIGQLVVVIIVLTIMAGWLSNVISVKNRSWLSNSTKISTRFAMNIVWYWFKWIVSTNTVDIDVEIGDTWCFIGRWLSNRISIERYLLFIE